MHLFADRWDEDSELYPKVAALLEGREVVLDVGCGDGLFAEYLASRGHTVLGVDNDPNVLPKDGVSTHFELADASGLPFGSSSFDAVVCISMLHCQAEPTMPLIEMARVLKPGGLVVIVGRAADKTAADMARSAKDLARSKWLGRGKTPREPVGQVILPSMGWGEWREVLTEFMPKSTFERVGSFRYLATWVRS